MAPAATLRRRGMEFSADGAKELFRLPPEHQRKSHARRAHDLVAVTVIRAVPLADVFEADRDDPVPLFFDKQIGPSDIPTVVIEAARPQAAPAEQKLVDISNIDKVLITLPRIGRNVYAVQTLRSVSRHRAIAAAKRQTPIR